MVIRFLIYRICSTALLLLFVFTMVAQDAAGTVNLDEGKALFKAQCNSCHASNMKVKLTGPALGGVEERWADYPRTDLYAWIRNSQALIATGHPRATVLWNEWKPNLMSNFTNLTDAQIENILGYIDGVYNGTYGPQPPPPPPPGETAADSSNNTPLFIVIALILVIFAVVLARIISNLDYVIKTRDTGFPVTRRTLAQTLTSKGVIGFVIFALIVLGGYTTVNNAIALGRQQGYKPGQPIKFSHAIHAGQQKIDCQYCHDGARRSKHSNIPQTNTCMNCHKAIEVGSQYGTAELTKIFASIGYDPNTDKYIPNYDNLSEEQIERIYKKWISDNYVAANNGTLGQMGEKIMNDQWEGIVASLKNPENGDNKIQGPIEWTRIHNLPDHAYFNHAQHVSVGQLECQTCHGKVEEMEVVAQHAPLSMGWCINCHRQTEVKFNDNDYYKNYYEKYHKEIANGTRKKVTVEDVGGLECQQCHY